MASDAIAVIPARGGSTRIPRKNIAAFNGKPMIAWAVGAALELSSARQAAVSAALGEDPEPAEDLEKTP